MFTGLVQAIGTVASVVHSDDGARIEVGTPLAAELSQGDSVLVNGVCLTATAVGGDFFSADLAPETVRRSTLGDLGSGDSVNLELPLRVQDRLGGHIVQGHVDARGTFLSAEEHGGSWTVRIGFPHDLARYLVFKGSVAVEGISLTVATLAAEHFEVAIIPKTWALTNLAHLRAGDAVNLEADIIAKYVERILAVDTPLKTEGSSLTMEKLSDLGFK